MSASSSEPHSPLAALGSDRMDGRAVLIALTALGAAQRTLVMRAGEVQDRLVALDDRLAEVAATERDTNLRVRSLQVGMAEIKALLAQALAR